MYFKQRKNAILEAVIRANLIPLEEEIEKLKARLLAVEEKQSKKYLSEQEEKIEVPFTQIMDEWLNGKEGNNGR